LIRVKKEIFLTISIVVLVLLCVLLFAMNAMFRAERPNDNKCFLDGIDYPEFSISPDKKCSCEGHGNGVDKAAWVCVGGDDDY